MRFDTPFAFLILLAIPIILYLRYRKRGIAGLRFSSIVRAKRAGHSWRQKLGELPFFLRLVVLILLAVALARPQEGKEIVRDVSKGVAMYTVIDRSGSMRAEMDYQGTTYNRLEVVKKVFKEFIDGGDDLPGRPNDLIGMIVFARYADTICPLTLSRGALAQFLKQVKLVKRRSEDGTAIGNAIALAAARLKTAEETLVEQATDKKKQHKIKSKVIILLTDGERNCGDISPSKAVAMAKKWGIKLYIIGI